ATSRGGGIRTPGAFQLNGFQDRRIRPLCHSSLCFRITAFRQLPLTLPLLQLRPTGQAGWIWDCKCTSVSLFRKDFLIPDLIFLIDHLFILFAPWSPSPPAQLPRSPSSPTPPPSPAPPPPEHLQPLPVTGSDNMSR